MKNNYILTRILFASVIGIIAGITTRSLLGGILMFTSSLLVILLLPRTGWYIVKKEGNQTRLSGDERLQQTRDKAGRYTLAICTISLAMEVAYFDYIGMDVVPIFYLSPILMFAGLGYLAMAYWFRRV